MSMPTPWPPSTGISEAEVLREGKARAEEVGGRRWEVRRLGLGLGLAHEWDGGAPYGVAVESADGVADGVALE